MNSQTAAGYFTVKDIICRAQMHLPELMHGKESRFYSLKNNVSKVEFFRRVFRILGNKLLERYEQVFWCDVLECVGHYSNHKCAWDGARGFVQSLLQALSPNILYKEKFDVKTLANQYFLSNFNELPSTLEEESKRDDHFDAKESTVTWLPMFICRQYSVEGFCSKGKFCKLEHCCSECLSSSGTRKLHGIKDCNRLNYLKNVF